jgi:DNA-binding XRE family transcriptional regulator
MGLIIARVKNAERMMTRAAVKNKGIKITFANGCNGVIPITDILEAGNPPHLNGIELPNPYQINIYSSKNGTVELCWDFVRHYCDSSYRKHFKAIASGGRKPLGKRIRSFREAAGMTQSKLATTAGIGRITEVWIENGEQSLRYETLISIAQALKRLVADLAIGELSAYS